METNIIAFSLITGLTLYGKKKLTKESPKPDFRKTLVILEMRIPSSDQAPRICIVTVIKFSQLNDF